jgi:pterin-4a-carbinolamine dehydratase
MRKFSTALLVSSLFFVSPVMAGADHDHGSGGHSHSQGPVSGDVAAMKASNKVKSMVESGKLDKSWAHVKATGASQKSFGHDPEWVVTFKNTKISDASKQTLYVFLTLDGMYIAANFTGN